MSSFHLKAKIYPLHSSAFSMINSSRSIINKLVEVNAKILVEEGFMVMELMVEPIYI